MTASFPISTKVFTTKVIGDIIEEEHINELQEEVVAIETELSDYIHHDDVTITAGAGLSGGGTIAASRTINLEHLGIEDLTDPGADRIAFWDDSAGAMKWLSPGTGLGISGTTLNSASIGEGDIADGAVTNAKIADGAVTNAKIANRVRKLFIPLTIYPRISGTSIIPNSTSAQFGAVLSSTEVTGNLGATGLLPSDYVANGTITPIVTTYLGTSSKKSAYFEYSIAVGLPTQGGPIASRGSVELKPTVSIPAITTDSPYMFVAMPALTLPNSVANDVFFIDFVRNPTNAADTLTGASLSISGFILTYTADS